MNFNNYVFIEIYVCKYARYTPQYIYKYLSQFCKTYKTKWLTVGWNKADTGKLE